MNKSYANMLSLLRAVNDSQKAVIVNLIKMNDTQREVISNMDKMNESLRMMIDMMDDIVSQSEESPIIKTEPWPEPQLEHQPVTVTKPKKKPFMSLPDRISLSELCDAMPEIQNIPSGTIYDACMSSKQMRAYKYDIMRDEFDRRGWTLRRSAPGTSKTQFTKWKRQIALKIKELIIQKTQK